MANLSKKTTEDLRKKLIFEKQLFNKLHLLNVKVVRRFRNDYDQIGVVLNANDFRDDYEELLYTHYKKVGNEFSNVLSRDLPENVEVTPNEEETIYDSLSLYYLTRSGSQSLLITDTNNEQIAESVMQGDELARQDDLFERAAAASYAAVILLRKFNARRNVIAVTETQNIAETAKLTEAQVLSGIDPTINGNLPVAIPKTWETVGDSKVRQSHADADGQTVPINDVFRVGGYSLMYPGDSNLGAPAKEIVNCRCSSQYDRDHIVNIREDEVLNNPPTFEE